MTYSTKPRWCLHLWFATTARLVFLLTQKDPQHNPTSYLYLTETLNSAQLKSLLQLYESFASKATSYFSNLHQPDFRWFITQLLSPHTLCLNSWIFPNHSRLSSHMSARRHLVLLWACWAMENLRSSLDAPPSSVHLHLHAKRAVERCTEASSIVKCVDCCWCFGGDQIYCRRRLSHSTIKQGWVTVGCTVWPLAFTCRHIPHTKRMKKWQGYSALPPCWSKSNARRSLRAAVTWICS